MKLTYRNNKRVRVTLKAYAVLVILAVTCGWLGLRAIARYNHVDGVFQLAPATKSYAAYVAPTPTITPTMYDTIHSYIETVFGKDAPKAFKLLQSSKCHENGKLNPEAINDNTTWGGKGQDIGVFQISNYWQGVTNKAFLTDYKINVNMAYNIYVRSGYSFKMWTCGKILGI